MNHKNKFVFTFLFPRTGEIPIGGFKVIYEYANRLVIDGHNVNIIYGIVSRPVSNIFMRLFYYAFRFLRWINYSFFKDFRPNSWFQTDSRINHILKYSLSENGIPQSNFIIATSWSTAVWLNKYKKIDNDHKLYFIQHFEDWNGTYDEVLGTWKMKLNKIVIAPWLEKIATDLNEKAFLIPNGFDQNEFYIIKPISEKDKYSVIMLWHDHPFKDCNNGLNALKLVKENYPQLKATFFGVPDKPNDLPDWISYYQMPDKSTHLKIYNESAIFIGPSSKEGFCLTPPEAMLCGCAVACTNIGGYTVVAKDNYTALLSPPSDSMELSQNIIKLIEDDSLRNKIALAGNSLIKEHTWEKSYNRFINFIENI